MQGKKGIKTYCPWKVKKRKSNDILQLFLSFCHFVHDKMNFGKYNAQHIPKKKKLIWTEIIGFYFIYLRMFNGHKEEWYPWVCCILFRWRKDDFLLCLLSVKNTVDANLCINLHISKSMYFCLISHLFKKESWSILMQKTYINTYYIWTNKFFLLLSRLHENRLGSIKSRLRFDYKPQWNLISRRFRSSSRSSNS